MPLVLDGKSYSESDVKKSNSGTKYIQLASGKKRYLSSLTAKQKEALEVQGRGSTGFREMFQKGGLDVLGKHVQSFLGPSCAVLSSTGAKCRPPFRYASDKKEKRDCESYCLTYVEDWLMPLMLKMPRVMKVKLDGDDKFHVVTSAHSVTLPDDPDDRLFWSASYGRHGVKIKIPPNVLIWPVEVVKRNLEASGGKYKKKGEFTLHDLPEVVQGAYEHGASKLTIYLPFRASDELMPHKTEPFTVEFPKSPKWERFAKSVVWRGRWFALEIPFSAMNTEEIRNLRSKWDYTGRPLRYHAGVTVMRRVGV